LLRESEIQVVDHQHRDEVVLEAARREAVELKHEDFISVKEAPPTRASKRGSQCHGS
jgi:hypothetical protein